jgi:branched-chain amino acid transport system ATP-binding protein
VNGAAPGDCQLELRGVTRVFGRLVAVDHVDCRVAAGERKAIIGPNGAGKTTLFNLISGLLLPTAGQIRFEGRDITRLPVHAIARLGVARSFQVTSVFPRLSVYENVRAAVLAHSRHAWSLFRRADRLHEIAERAHRVLDDVGLTSRQRLPADVLSHGDRRLLDLAMALASDPRLLLLDEPTAGMSPAETRQTAELIPRLAGGRTVILVEHDMDVVMSIATSILVLARGAKLAEGTPEEIARDSRVQEAYLGGVIN